MPAAASRTVRDLRASEPARRTISRRASSSMPTAPASPRSSASARSMSAPTSSAPSGRRVSSRERDSRGETTEKLGFSVVAATRTTQRFSTPGSRASCWVREKRCTSSMNRTVSSPPTRWRRASAMTSRTCPTPADTADSSTKRRPEARATRWARVVLPVPGGPHRMMLDTPAPRPRAPSAGSTSRRRGEPGASRWSWPRTSSRLRGRMRTASGARASRGRPASSVPALSKRSTPRPYRRAAPAGAPTAVLRRLRGAPTPLRRARRNAAGWSDEEAGAR